MKKNISKKIVLVFTLFTMVLFFSGCNLLSEEEFNNGDANEDLDFQDVFYFTEHDRVVWSTAFSPVDYTAVSGDQSGNIKVWDARTGNVETVFSDHDSYVNTLVVSPDGQIIASSAYDERLIIWDKDSGEILSAFGGEDQDVRNLAFYPEGDEILLHYRDYEEDKRKLVAWNWNEERVTKTFSENVYLVNDFAFTNDGSKVATGGNNNKLWNAETGELIKELSQGPGNTEALEFTPDDTKLVTGEWEGTINIIDVDSGEIEEKYIKHVEERPVPLEGLNVHPDGDKVISAGYDSIEEDGDGTAFKDPTIKVWDLETGEDIVKYDEIVGAIGPMDLSYDGKLVACAASHSVHVWKWGEYK